MKNKNNSVEKLSVIIPFLNEEENLGKLYEELLANLEKLNLEYEIIFVNDGSTDNGSDIVKKFVKTNPSVFLIEHKVKKGKGDALATGLKKASGSLILFMDADLQDDPADIKKFYEKIQSGYDFVNGIRSKREDNLVIKLYSKTFNWFLKKFLRSPFTDINCGFKMFRKEIADSMSFYANNFRFLPLYAYYQGYKTTEVEVSNRPRIYGKSKFGIKKIFIGIIDTLTTYFLYRFSQRPLHFFGVIGGSIFSLGLIILSYLSFERIFLNHLLYRRPLLQFGVLLIVVGVQIIMTGFLGELIVFFNKQKNK
ncbi:MAG: glycosyl transferase family 2 [Patescibacteria group bacterium]|nr:MAG: glycosyl transferase family 2 [Patescibacteria group bacterium]